MAELNTCTVFIMMAMRRNLPEALWNIPRYSTAFHSHTLRTHVILVVVKMSNTLRTHVILVDFMKRCQRIHLKSTVMFTSDNTHVCDDKRTISACWSALLFPAQNQCALICADSALFFQQSSAKSARISAHWSVLICAAFSTLICWSALSDIMGSKFTHHFSLPRLAYSKKPECHRSTGQRKYYHQST